MALETITVNGTTYRVDFGGLANVPDAGISVAGVAKYDGATITRNADGQLCTDGLAEATTFVPETDASDLTFSGGEAEVDIVNFPVQGQAVKVTVDGVPSVATCVTTGATENEVGTDEFGSEYPPSVVIADGFSIEFTEGSATVVLDQAGTVPFETLSVTSASTVPTSTHPRLRGADMVYVAGATTGQSSVQVHAAFTADVTAGMTAVVLVDGVAHVTDVGLFQDFDFEHYVGCALDQSDQPDYESAPFRVELRGLQAIGGFGSECDVTFLPLEDGEAHQVDVWLAVTSYDYVANQAILSTEQGYMTIAEALTSIDAEDALGTVGVVDRMRVPGERYDSRYGSGT